MEWVPPWSSLTWHQKVDITLLMVSIPPIQPFLGSPSLECIRHFHDTKLAPGTVSTGTPMCMSPLEQCNMSYCH